MECDWVERASLRGCWSLRSARAARPRPRGAARPLRRARSAPPPGAPAGWTAGPARRCTSARSAATARRAWKRTAARSSRPVRKIRTASTARSGWTHRRTEATRTARRFRLRRRSSGASSSTVRRHLAGSPASARILFRMQVKAVPVQVEIAAAGEARGRLPDPWPLSLRVRTQVDGRQQSVSAVLGSAKAAPVGSPPLGVHVPGW